MPGSTHLTSNFTGTGSSTGDKVTYSVWIKRMDPEGDARSTVISADGGDANNYMKLRFADDDKFHIYGVHSSSGNFNVYADKQCRDTNAWYHLVWQIDTTHATESERVKVWINGESISISGTMPSQNDPIYTLKMDDMEIGRNAQADNEQFDGIMSHFHCCHGYLYAPTVFGSTDATTGEWKINAGPSVSYGTKGWFIFKDNASVTDQSGNGNSFTVGAGSLEASQDNPSNVFSNMMKIHDYANANSDLGSSNNFVWPMANSNFNFAVSTMGMPQGNGKFYIEAKYVEYDNIEVAVGVVNMDYVPELFYENRNIVTAANQTYIGRAIVNSDGHSIIAGTANSSYGLGSWSNGDIISIACDMENGAFYFRKNGAAWANSGDPTSGASKTGAIDLSATSQWTTSSHWGVWCGCGANNNDRFSFNFGNGYFPSASGSGGSQDYAGATISSAGTNASNFGIFEYDVPTGYTALCTKGLNL